MIVVWNSHSGQTYGFESLDAYKEFAKSTEGDGRTCWDDQVHDVGAGGEATGDNQLTLTQFNSSLT